ncbi:MAG: pyrimidine 5'-nucleotidase [Burkholderiaceae bacterium]
MRPLRGALAQHRARHPFGSSRDADRVWLFDLDNTLHDCSKGIFQAIDGAMARAVATTLSLDAQAANALRTQYWKRYGATVIGMVRHHGVDAKAFLKLSHDFQVAPLVHCETGLGRKLKLLQGRKIILTNAPLDYAHDVLKALGILHHFECVWAIDHMKLQGVLRPKPSAALMRQIVARLGVPAQRIVLVDDTLRNLKGARQAGMRTVHVFHPETPFSSRHSGRSLYVDVKVRSAGRLLAGSHALRKPGSPDRA